MPAPAFRHGIAPCPGCDAQLAAPFQAAGRNVTCKCCGTRFSLPHAEELFEAAVAYLLDQQDANEDDDEDEQFVAQQIQHETMVRTRETADVSWLG